VTTPLKIFIYVALASTVLSLTTTAQVMPTINENPGTPEASQIPEAGITLETIPQLPIAEPITEAIVVQPPVQMPSGNLMQQPVSALPSIADLVEEVSSAVLNIVVRTEDGETTSEGQGSGFIISSKGEVVTNYHVIDGGTTITVEFNNGEILPAQVVGTDEETDMALLQIDVDREFPTVSFHDGEDIRIGDWVVAIGNPFGIGQSTSLGVISAIGRERVDSGSYVDYIQTDATINRGNSGGPLFDLNGNVVGVNSAIYSPTGASVGIAFVIPHYTAMNIVNAIRKDGRVRRGYLGAGLRTAEFEREDDKGVFKAGATIENVVPGGPAQTYGLQSDDIILNIDGRAVRNAVDATRIIGRMRPGQASTFIYERDEQTYSIDMTIGERPSKEDVQRNVAISQGLPVPPKREPKRGKVNIDTGMQVLDLSSSFRDAIGMRPDQSGVYVESVVQGSAADVAGFRMGMVLMEIDIEQIAEVSAFKSIILNSKLGNKSSVLVKVRKANGQETYLTLPLV